MKKIMIITVFASLAFASCKKERVCECVVSSDAPGSSSATVKYTATKAKKDICEKNSYSTIQTSPTSSSGGNYTTKVACTLK